MAIEDKQPDGVFAEPGNPSFETVVIEDTQRYFAQSSNVGKDYIPAGQEWMWCTADDAPVAEPFGCDSIEDGIWPRDPSSIPQFCYPETVRPTTSKSTSYTFPQRYDAQNPPEEEKCARGSDVCGDVRNQGVPGGVLIPELPEGACDLNMCAEVSFRGPRGEIRDANNLERAKVLLDPEENERM